MEFVIRKGPATLAGLESTSLKEFNEANSTKRARLTFSYVISNSEDATGATSLDSLLQSCSTENSYSVIIDLSGLGESELERLKDAVSTKQQANFSTVICSIEQMTDGKFPVVLLETSE